MQKKKNINSDFRFLPTTTPYTWLELETKLLRPLASSPVLICVHHSREDLDTTRSLTFKDQSTGTALEAGGLSFFVVFTGFGDSSWKI